MRAFSASQSAMVALLGSVAGLTTNPGTCAFTRFACATCASSVRL
jgi:hypothetical protein